MYISSSAPACPHCGRPGRKSRPPMEIVVGLGIGVLCLAGLAWQSGWDNEATRGEVAPVANPETAIARPYRQLTQSLDAFVGYNRTLYLFRVENRDAFAWTHCLLSLNSHGISGYELDVEGQKFDPTTNQVTTLDLDCETPDGHRYYRGKFGPRDVAGR